MEEDTFEDLHAYQQPDQQPDRQQRQQQQQQQGGADKPDNRARFKKESYLRGEQDSALNDHTSHTLHACTFVIKHITSAVITRTGRDTTVGDVEKVDKEYSRPKVTFALVLPAMSPAPVSHTPSDPNKPFELKYLLKFIKDSQSVIITQKAPTQHGATYPTLHRHLGLQCICANTI